MRKILTVLSSACEAMYDPAGSQQIPLTKLECALITATFSGLDSKNRTSLYPKYKFYNRSRMMRDGARLDSMRDPRHLNKIEDTWMRRYEPDSWPLSTLTTRNPIRFFSSPNVFRDVESRVQITIFVSSEPLAIYVPSVDHRTQRTAPRSIKMYLHQF